MSGTSIRCPSCCGVEESRNLPTCSGKTDSWVIFCFLSVSYLVEFVLFVSRSLVIQWVLLFTLFLGCWFWVWWSCPGTRIHPPTTALYHCMSAISSSCFVCGSTRPQLFHLRSQTTRLSAIEPQPDQGTGCVGWSLARDLCPESVWGFFLNEVIEVVWGHYMGVSESTMILRLMRCTVCDVEVRNVNGSLLLNIHYYATYQHSWPLRPQGSLLVGQWTHSGQFICARC